MTGPPAEPDDGAAGPPPEEAPPTGDRSSTFAARALEELRHRSVWQTLGAYLVASWVVLQVAATLGSLIGLPLGFGRWVLALLLALLPIVLLTGVAQSGREDATRRGEGRLRTLFTWRNAALAAGVGFAALGIGTAAHLALRALGVGPGAPLIARGVLEEREPLLLADFESRGPDSLLGGAVTEALRIDLQQSPAITLVSAERVRDALSRMRREPDTRLDPTLAAEVARREGVKGYIAGGVHPLGSAHVISVRLLSSDSGSVMAADRETADGREEIIEAVDRLSKRLRARIGESLASVRRSRSLPSVTTSSLEALELYAAAQRLARLGDDGTLPLFSRAVAADPSFAMAYRGLSIAHSSRGDPVEAAKYAELAHRHGERLPLRERYLSSAAFHASRGRIDSTAYYYRLLLDVPPDTNVALNNLGDAYESMGRYREALRLYRRAVRARPDHVVGYYNMASAARTLGRHALADSVLGVMRERFPYGRLHGNTEASNAFYAGDLARLEAAVGRWAQMPDPQTRAAGRQWLASVAGMRGRVERSLALADSAAAYYAQVGSPRWAAAALQTLVNAAWVARPAAAVPYLERWLPYFRASEVATAAPRFLHDVLGLFATAYALAGDAPTARSLTAEMDSLAAAADFRASGIGDHARAALAYRADRPEEALAHLERARVAEFGLVHDYSRLLAADAYAALGRPREAAVHYDSAATTVRLHWSDSRAHGPLQAVAHERAGLTRLAAGDTTAALRHLAAFVELWSEADPELQPRVRSARERLEEILALRG